LQRVALAVRQTGLSAGHAQRVQHEQRHKTWRSANYI
jgi:hypothetical protein